MRRLFLMVLGFITLVPVLYGQRDTSSYSVDEFREITTDVMVGYYEQTGNHSAVTGGEGSEKLNAMMPTIIVNIPFRNGHDVTLELGGDAYSSASSSKINMNAASGASSGDIRVHGVASYNKTMADNDLVWGATTSFSNEFDYFSFGFGGSVLKMFNNENTQLGFAANVYLDNWDLIYPNELRGQGELLATDKRNSYSLSFSYSQVLSRRVQMALFADVVNQRGLLSTPFHRVYFSDYGGGTVPKVEMLPDVKWKFPVGMRLNYFATDWLVTRFYYRYYQDDFDVKGHTFNVTLPFKVNDIWTLSPIYRFYQQSATKYFAAKGEHTESSDYYTSDYDLSGFNSQSVGLELGYKRIDGIFHYGKKRTNRLEAVRVRYTYYHRSDALEAHLLTIGFTFKN